MKRCNTCNFNYLITQFKKNGDEFNMNRNVNNMCTEYFSKAVYFTHYGGYFQAPQYLLDSKDFQINI